MSLLLRHLSAQNRRQASENSPCCCTILLSALICRFCVGTSIEVESTSTLHNSSPLPVRHSKLNRHILHVPDASSRLTINTTFGSQLIEANEETRRGPRPRRVLSSIASSSDEHNKSQGMLNKVRESKSLDPLPLGKPTKLLEKSNPLLQLLKRSTRSLENCDKCGGDIQIIAIPDNRLINNNCPNGNIVNITHDDTVSFNEDVEVPLLNPTTEAMILHRRRIGSSGEEVFEDMPSKRYSVCIFFNYLFVWMLQKHMSLQNHPNPLY